MEYITNKPKKTGKPLVKKIPTLIIGLALLVGGISVYRLTQTNTSESEVPVQTMPEIKTVTALGRLEPSGEIIQISVSSAAEGNRIDELLVNEGDEIERGQIIAVLDSRDRLEAVLNQAQEEVKVAQANLDLVKAGAKTGEIQAQEAAIARIEAERDNDIMAQNATVSRIKAELDNAQLEYQRYEQLYKDGAISASERDSKYLTLATAKEQLAEAQANLNRIKSSQEKQIAEAKATLNQIAEVRPVDVAVAEAEVRQALNTYLPEDVEAYTHEEYVEKELAYIQNRSPIGFVFTLGTTMGFIVGIVIVYQVLSTDVNDHMAEYATFKAMGYKNSYLLFVVFEEALILSLAGFIPSTFLAMGLYQLTAAATALSIVMPVSRGITVLVMTIVMCGVSGAIATRKLQSADPADIF